MKTVGTLSIISLLLISITLIGCNKLGEEEFNIWKNEHVAQIEQTNTEIKKEISKLDTKVDQNNKATMEAISKAKDEAIAASQQGDADTIAAAAQKSKEEDAKLRTALTKDINTQIQKVQDFAKTEDAKTNSKVNSLSELLSALADDVKKLSAAVSANSDDISNLKEEAASKPTLLVTVNFGSGQTGLSKEGKELLDGIVAQILENPEGEILIVGHADGTPVLRGHHRSNWDLSQTRANSAAKYLKGKGVDAARIKAVGKAHTDPVAPQNTTAGRAMNRRVEIILNPSGSL